MRLTFLGTGTSFGIPMIGCGCDVCCSSDPRDRRRRAALWIESGDTALLVDTPPDLREQALTFGVSCVDAVFITHTHADHIFGMDDLRAFSMRDRAPLPVYGDAHTTRHLRQIFAYAESPCPTGVTVPRLGFKTLAGPVQIGSFKVSSFPVEHGNTPTLGYLFEDGMHSTAYVPDCKRIPAEAMPLLKNLDVMILDTLKPTPHPNHLSFQESLDLFKVIAAKRSFGTHICHHLSHAHTEARLPPGVLLAYDGLMVQL